MTLTEAQVRAINLIEVLLEEAEEAGSPVPEPPENSRDWTDAQIHAYVASGGKVAPAASAGAAFPEPAPSDFATWFPGLKLSGTSNADAKVRILCFPNAGNSEDLYTSEGTGNRRAVSPLLAWARASGAEVLAVQYPGRAARRGEAFVPSASAMAAALAPVAAARLAAADEWVVVGHSAGAWVAYETILLLASRGLRPPAAVYLSAMAAPCWPEAERPWRPQSGLDEAAFVDECRAWDVAELLFSPALWPVYQPIMRSDFRLFDEYRWGGGAGGHPPSLQPVPAALQIPAPVLAFWGSRDRRISERMVRAWEAVVGGPFRARQVEGTHLWPLDKVDKAAWLGEIVADLSGNDAVCEALARARS